MKLSAKIETANASAASGDPRKVLRNLTIVSTPAIVASLAYPLFPPFGNAKVAVWIRVISAFVGAGVVTGIYLSKVRHSGLKYSSCRLAFLIQACLAMPLIGYDVLAYIHSRAVRRIASEMGAVSGILNGRTDQIAAGNELVLRLSEIKPGFAPSDFRQALQESVERWKDEMLAARRKDMLAQVAAQNDAEIAKRELVALCNKYE